jgi:hypothetical protein
LIEPPVNIWPAVCYPWQTATANFKLTMNSTWPSDAFANVMRSLVLVALAPKIRRGFDTKVDGQATLERTTP